MTQHPAGPSDDWAWSADPDWQDFADAYAAAFSDVEDDQRVAPTNIPTVVVKAPTSRARRPRQLALVPGS